mmetsp:Transcript_13005/g.45728  ORF Transcript_13005/g.45728 Transcript_13005/m.45728 type:complete len:208 (+) Transcript_13005:326-949(+)
MAFCCMHCWCLSTLFLCCSLLKASASLFISSASRRSSSFLLIFSSSCICICLCKKALFSLTILSWRRRSLRSLSMSLLYCSSCAFCTRSSMLRSTSAALFSISCPILSAALSLNCRSCSLRALSFSCLSVSLALQQGLSSPVALPSPSARGTASRRAPSPAQRSQPTALPLTLTSCFCCRFLSRTFSFSLSTACDEVRRAEFPAEIQ